MKTRIILTIILFFPVCCLDAQNLNHSELDNYIANIIIQDKLPGLSIAIVLNDSVIYAKGFGVRKLGDPDPVSEYTMFECASLTKSFTATLIGMLVEQGKIKWTDPVVKYIPDFKTSEQFVTEKITIQDLLTVRSGLLDGDKLVCKSRMDLIPQIKNLKISDSFRLIQSSYNLNYTIAGYIAEIIEGKSWEEMVRDKIFYPLKMNETYTDIKSATTSYGNIAVPHRVKNGIITPSEWENYGVFGPAEGIYSNVMDLSKWVRLQLNNGIFENISIIKPETLKNMQNPQIIANNIFKGYFNPEANIMAMGLGWFISDYKGYKVIQMAGSFPGTTNLISIIPVKKIGMIIQSNKGGAFSSFVSINYRIFNDLFSR